MDQRLIYSLKKRVLRWWPLPVVVGALFGAYHFVQTLDRKTSSSSTQMETPLDGSSTSVEAGEEPSLVPAGSRRRVFEKALSWVDNGDEGNLIEARRLIGNLAPLAGPVENGYAPAHLWAAKDLLSPQDPRPQDEKGTNANENRSSSRPALDRDALKDVAEHLRRAIELDPVRQEAYELLAILYVQTGEANRGISLLEDALEKLPNLRLQLAELHYRLGAPSAGQTQAQEAARYFKEQALTDPSEPVHRIHWAKAELLQDNHEAALAIIERGKGLYNQPEFQQLHLRSIRRQFDLAMQEDPPNYQAAWAHVENLFDLGSEDPHAVNRLGQLCVVPETAERARSKLLDLSSTSNASGNTFTLLGDLEAKEGNYSAAATYYDKAISINGNDIFARNNLAQSLILLDPPQTERALTQIDKAISLQAELTPGGANANHLETRGQILLKLGRFAEAAPDFERALSGLSPEIKRRAHGSLAEIYQHLGNTRMAETHRKLSVVASPGTGS